MRQRLRKAFERFDRDSDGRVVHHELAVGLLSAAESWPEAAQRPVPMAHAFGQQQCANPSLDALSFAECLVARARLRLHTSGRERLAPIHFVSELAAFLSGCEHPTAAWLDGTCLGSCSSCAAVEDRDYGSQMDTVESDSVESDSVAAHGGEGVGVAEHGGEGVGVLISSDMHVEPWYLATRSVARDCGSLTAAVCRFPGANETNMFECRDAAGRLMPSCPLDGRQDPPLPFDASHLAAAAAENASVHLFVGDTQAHSFTGQGWSQAAAISLLLGRVLDLELAQFGSAGVVWTAGNNDGPHDAIFQAPDAATLAWGAALLSRHIVTDELGIVYEGGRSQTALFNVTGFYAKQLPALGPAAYAVVLNTNLGAANTVQTDALNTTLEWIAARHGGQAAVYLLGHHPAVMSVGAAYVATPYRPMVRGVFAGHVHYASATTPDLFTQVGAITQNAVDVAFFIARVLPGEEIRMTRSQLHRYRGKAGLPADASQWR